MFDLSGFWALIQIKLLLSSFSESVCGAKADFELFHIIFLSSVDYLHCFSWWLFVSWRRSCCCATLCWLPCVQITNVLSALISWVCVLDFGRIFVEKEKCSRKNSVADIFSDWHLLKLFSFFRLASVKVVFCSPVCWASSKLTVEAEINH